MGSTTNFTIRSALLVMLIALIADKASGAPSDIASFRGGQRDRGSSGWGVKIADRLHSITQDNNRVPPVDDVIKMIVRRDASPSLRLFLYDRLFRRHLQLMIDKPSSRHLRQLQNRLTALHRRRTD